MYFPRPTKKTDFESVIDSALTELAGHEADSEGYQKTVDNIVKLHTLKQSQKRDRPSFDAVVTVSANLLGILMIVKHEETAVLTSKAISMFKFGK